MIYEGTHKLGYWGIALGIALALALSAIIALPWIIHG